MRDPNKVYVRLPLESAPNVRELGGYAGMDGRPTRFKRFLRSGTPEFITQKEADFLKDYGIRLIIDLRTDEEAARDGGIITKGEQIRRVQKPFIAGDLSAKMPDMGAMATMGKLYSYILDGSGQTIAETLREIAQEKGGVLYHCTAGKDRTGVLSYLLLAIAGVSDLDIIANYQITETYFIPTLKERGKDFVNTPSFMMRSEASNMEETIAHINQKYGGALGYLHTIGVTDGEIAAIRESFLD